MLPLGVPGLAARAAGGGADPFQGAGGAAAGLGAAAEAGLQVRRGQGGAVAKRGTRRTPQNNKHGRLVFFVVFFFFSGSQSKRSCRVFVQDIFSGVAIPPVVGGKQNPMEDDECWSVPYFETNPYYAFFRGV